ncbi:helix-turn-helix domain-containing protein (plasmid) [Kribbella sp. CA-253562]|uniref:helix-turn-helix domain-containing protein n=1 Tax=Kribbella sp. CA-253562 TaxID=3239942 RepID=UPI003D8D3F5D
MAYGEGQEVAARSERNLKLRDARRALGMTQAELAERVSRRLRLDPPIDGNYLSKLERGIYTWPTEAYRQAMRAELGAGSDAELGFYSSRSAPEQDPPNVDRRSFFALGPAAVAGGMIGGSSAADFLANIDLPDQAPALVGRADVDHIAQSIRAFKAWDRSVGGELSIHAVAGQLRWAATLLDARATQPGVRDDLHSAVGHLAQVLAWMVVDCGAHDVAHRYFRFAVHCAEEAGNHSLRSVVLSTMSRHHFLLGQYDDALSTIELAQVRADRLPEAEQSMLSVVRSRPLAKLGRRSDALAAIGTAEDLFAAHDPRRHQQVAWMEFFDQAELAGDAGHSLADLALAGAAPEPALDQLGYAVASHTTGYNRARAFCHLKSAALWMNVDPAVGVQQGAQAIGDAESLRSGRVRSYMRDLHSAAAPHKKRSDVAVLRRDIARLAQVPA